MKPKRITVTVEIPRTYCMQRFGDVKPCRFLTNERNHYTCILFDESLQLVYIADDQHVNKSITCEVFG